MEQKWSERTAGNEKMQRGERQSSSERGWGAENPPEVQLALAASNSPYFSNSGSCSSLWFSGGTTCVLTSSEQKSSLHNSALREGGGMGTGQSPSTSPSPHSQLGPGCLCSCSGSQRARPQGQPQAQTSSLASWFTTGISHNRPVVSTLRTCCWTLLLLFHIHTISLSGSDEQKYTQQISEEERKEEKRCIFLAHHLDALLGRCANKHAIPLIAGVIKPNWIRRTGCYLYYFFSWKLSKNQNC